MDSMVVDELMRSWYGETADQPHLLVEKLRESCPRFVPTYLSAREQLPGTEPLPPSLAQELLESDARSRHYIELQSEIETAFPAAWFLKGNDLARLYDPVSRYSRDLDVVVETTEDLWAVANWLVEREYGPFAMLAVGVVQGQLDHMITLREPAREWEHAAQVEVSTMFWVGNGGAVPTMPRRDLDAPFGHVRHLITIAARLFNNPEFTVKDVLDAFLLLEDGGEQVAREAIRYAASHGILPELAQLVTLVVEHLPRDSAAQQAAAMPPAMVRRHLAERRLGRLRAVARRPRAALALWAQHNALLGSSRVPRGVAALFCTFGSPGSPGGPWLFGLPCRSTRPIDVTHAARVLSTPIGEFLLTPTAEVSEDDLKELALEPA